MWKSSGNIEDELRYACLHNDLKTVRKLSKLNINMKIENSPFLIACYYGNFDIVQELISNQKAIIEYADKNGVRPIHYAVEQQHTNIVRLLLGHAANINAQTNIGRTPLHYASEVGNGDLIKLLLARGADKTLKDKFNQTALDIASKNRRNPSIIALFESTNDYNVNSHIHNLLHTKEIKKTQNLHSVEIERERIMRGEISNLKNKIYKILSINDSLKQRIDSIEDLMQELSVSVSSILSTSPNHDAINHNTTNNMNNNNAHINHMANFSTIAVAGKQQQQTDTQRNRRDTPLFAEHNSKNHKFSDYLTPTVDMNELSIGYGTDNDSDMFELESRECKEDRPQSATLNLKEEASLDLGGYSYDYNNLSSKLSTPRLSLLDNMNIIPETSDAEIFDMNADKMHFAVKYSSDSVFSSIKRPSQNFQNEMIITEEEYKKIMGTASKNTSKRPSHRSSNSDPMPEIDVNALKHVSDSIDMAIDSFQMRNMPNDIGMSGILSTTVDAVKESVKSVEMDNVDEPKFELYRGKSAKFIEFNFDAIGGGGGRQRAVTLDTAKKEDKIMMKKKIIPKPIKRNFISSQKRLFNVKNSSDFTHIQPKIRVKKLYTGNDGYTHGHAQQNSFSSLKRHLNHSDNASTISSSSGKSKKKPFERKRKTFQIVSPTGSV